MKSSASWPVITAHTHTQTRSWRFYYSAPLVAVSRTAGGHLAIWTGRHTHQSQRPIVGTLQQTLVLIYYYALRLHLCPSLFWLGSWKMLHISANGTECVLGQRWCEDQVAISDMVDCLVKQRDDCCYQFVKYLLLVLCLEMMGITKKDKEWKVHYISLGNTFCSLNCPAQIELLVFY